MVSGYIVTMAGRREGDPVPDRSCTSPNSKSDAQLRRIVKKRWNMGMLLALGVITCLVWGAILWLSFFDEKSVGLIGMPVKRESDIV